MHDKHVINYIVLDDEGIWDEPFRVRMDVKIDDEKRGVDIRT